MVVLTRSQSTQALKHVVEVVFNRGEGSETWKALQDFGCDDILDLASMREADIDQLTYLDDSASPPALVDLPAGRRGMIHAFVAWVAFRSASGRKIQPQEWITLTAEEFNEFRISPDFYRIRYTQSIVSAAPAAALAGVNPRGRDPVADFKKGIKRDLSAFIPFKDEKQWDNWSRSTQAQARAQDVSEVLDPNFKPQSPQDIALFAEKQKFMSAVFEKTLLTDEGKALVRRYHATADAQAIYKALADHATKSTAATISSSDLLSYITSARIGQTTWNGTVRSFILHWLERVRLYEDLVDSKDRFTDGLKRVMLQNVVHPLAELRVVQTQADQLKVNTGKDHTFDEYLSLLLSAATNYDSQFKATKKPLRPQRSIYAHDFDVDIDPDPDPDPDGDVFFDIDTTVDTVRAYTARTERARAGSTRASLPGSRMSLSQWKRLPNNVQEIWDKIPDSYKAVILERPRAMQSRQANLHDMSAHDFIQAQLHELQLGSEGDVDLPDDNNVAPTSDNHDSDALLAHMTKQKRLPPGDIQRVLSSSMAKPSSKPSPNSKSSESHEVVIDGKRYRSVNMTKIVYSASKHCASRQGSLIDRGANGGIAGEDVRVIAHTTRSVDVQGIDNHQIVDIPIVTAGGVIHTQHGEVIGIFHQYAYTGKGKSIHSSAQLEYFMNDVNDKSVKIAGGQQRITTPDGYVIPLNIKSGLPYMSIRPYTDQEWDTLPHVVLTGDSDWDPSVLDHNLDDDEEWFDAVSDVQIDPTSSLFDEYGEYRHRVVVQEAEITDNDLDNHILPTQKLLLQAHERVITNNPPNFARLRPYFAWLPVETIRRTFDCTTQYARLPMSTHLKQWFKSPFPALNVPRRSEPVATDMVYSDTPAVDSGVTRAQLFVGTESLVTDVYPMKTDKQFVNTLLDNIRERGAPIKLVSDRAQVEVSKRIYDILRMYCISSWQSEPHRQHQNPAERRIQTVKTMANTVMDRTGSPPSTWLLCLMYVCFVLNHTATASRNWRNPLFLATGKTTDISPLLRFHWYEPVYYKLDDHDFPAESREKRGRFVGIAEHVGHAMTYKILTDDTNKVIYRSNVRSALNPEAPNLRLDLFDGEQNQDPVIKSSLDSKFKVEDDSDPKIVKESQVPTFDPSDIIGRTFLMEPNKDGERHRARIVEAIEDHNAKLEDIPDRIKFLCSVNNDEYEEVLAYNEILERIEQESKDDTVWKFKRITAHEGPLKPTDHHWKGSNYNVMIEWETGEITSEPLGIIAADDPVTCAIYASENNLLELDGWKRFKCIANRQKKLFRMANQAKLRSFRTAPRYKYGFEVPRDYKHAMQLDQRNGNTKWSVAIVVEMEQMDEYDTFIDHGLDGKPPDGYKKIRVHLVFDVKHDGRHKARLVADGHLTEVPLDSVYSGVVSLRGLRILIFLAELNGLDTWATDIGNAYLEALTKEKVYIIAGPEFGERQGHVLVIYKALYGLRTSGLRWHERFADCLRDLGFDPCKAEPDIWMRPAEDHYEYIAVYVDDLAIAMKDPASFLSVLTEKYKFKLKGSGSIAFHLGCDFFRDETGTLCMAPRQYIEKMVASYERMFGCKPKTVVTSPLEKGDHPELDTTDLCDAEDTQKYQSLVGSMQWAISLGRFDISTAVMTLSGFRASPRIGHLDRAKRVCGYLSKMRDAIIRFRTGEPDYSDLPIPEYDWAASVYGNVEEEVPSDTPVPLGKFVVLTHYVDANLYHDWVTGRSVTGILHLVNGTVIDWYSKKQSTVETATYGSEFVASRTCVEQIIDLRNTLRYLGVPLRNTSYMFGDNKSVVDSSMHPHAKLHKRHTALSFHRVREAIAGRIVAYFHIPGERNPADIMSKHWGYRQVWQLLQPLLFWQGDTLNIPTFD